MTDAKLFDMPVAPPPPKQRRAPRYFPRCRCGLYEWDAKRLRWVYARESNVQAFSLGGRECYKCGCRLMPGGRLEMPDKDFTGGDAE